MYHLLTSGVKDKIMVKYHRNADVVSSLSEEEHWVTQQSGTERPGTGKLLFNKEPGVYVDIVSGEPLFASSDKYESGCGWPSFTKPIETTNVIEIKDNGQILHIQSLVVKPSQFRKGMASAMIAFVLNENMECNFTVETGCDNLPAINLYLKFGFVEKEKYETDHGVHKICLFLDRSGN